MSLIPLLIGKIVINSLTFQAPEFQIITDERGLLNLAELAVRKNESRALPTVRSTVARTKIIIPKVPSQQNKGEWWSG